jgi:hypothetical protein
MGKWRKNQNRAFEWLYALPVALVLLLAGCRSDEDAYFEARLEASGMDQKPKVLEIEPPVKGSECITLGSLRLTLPAGWAAVVKSLGEWDPSDEEGFRRGWSGNVTMARESGLVEVNLCYADGPRYVVDPPEAVLATPRRLGLRPKPFIKQYRTDLEFFEAVHNVVPEDLAWTFGDKRERIKVLLVEKSFRGWMDKRYSRPGLEAFIGGSRYPPAAGYADLFDKKGNYRGLMFLRFAEDFPLDQAEKVVAQLLYYAEFVGLPPL